MSFEIKPATRSAFKPLIGLYAESGAGKTYSALLLARGLAGPSGRVTMIDTEGGRGSLYADMIPGGYHVIDMEPPFPPGKLIDAIEVAEKATDVLVIDSVSHFWEGIGGVLEWAGELEAEGKKGRQVWKDPKMAHERMVARLLQTRLPIIVCLRAKHLLIEQINPQTRKKEMVKDPNATPKQSEDFIFCLTVHAEIRQDHSLRLTKISHPTLQPCFPVDGPITIETGQKLAAWCANLGSAPAAKETKSDIKTLKLKLWNLTEFVHGNDGGNMPKLEQWLRDECASAMPDGKKLSELTASELETLLAELLKNSQVKSFIDPIP